ncbi:hypothetical protein D3X11_06395 [Streptococcus sp. X16XC17]|uniref:hypothetical protein n=1 Tax=unclassified Streptococcus TaxID=2608887 RepID=UPI00066FFE57|nr:MULTISPECIES: hypothetical protein [unclassified Streptococcus]TCD45835.1 hypothetical protein D3X11_06395 [Streptococcus sp. X16XC17]
MKNKGITSAVALLAILALTACSNWGGKKEDGASSSSSKIEKTSSTEETTASTAMTLKESTITYLSDAEIEAVQTLEDYKQAFRSLMDSYVADFDELVTQVPPVAQKNLTPYREQLVQMMDEQYKALEEQFATIGDDDASIPDSVRETLVSTLKAARDQLTQAMTTIREQAENLMEQ